MPRQTDAERQRKHREGNAARLRHTVLMLHQALERLDTIEAHGLRLDRELTIAATERRAANAVNELLLKRITQLEREARAVPEDRAPPKFTRGEFPKDRYRGE